MTVATLQFVSSAAIIIVAATFLSRFADVIAEATGLGRLLVGSILLAGATSLPELAVDISAVRMRLPNVAVGDLMGSSLMNLLILGVIDLLPGSGGRALTRISSAHALPGALSIVLTALAAVAIVTRSNVTIYNISVAGIGLALAYGFGMRMVFWDQKLSAPLDTADPTIAKAAHRPGAFAKSLIGFSLAALVILIAAPFLARSAGQLAELSGLGGTFVGTTLVAISTSLPELVASLAALRIGAPDLALGNLLGSNVFNMVLLLPIDLAYPGPLFYDVSSTHALTALTTIVVTAIVIMGQLYQSERRVRLVEPNGWLIVLLVIGSLAMVFLNRDERPPVPDDPRPTAQLVQEGVRALR
jgi:cation:H+ antiporter